MEHLCSEPDKRHIFKIKLLHKYFLVVLLTIWQPAGNYELNEQQ